MKLTKKIRLVIEALSISFNIDKKQVQYIFAKSLNMTWICVQENILNNEGFLEPKSEEDENKKNNDLAILFSRELNIDKNHCLKIVKEISPFSKKKPKTYKEDNLSKTFDIDNEIGDLIFDSMKEALSNDPSSLEFIETINGMDDFLERARISHPINPIAFIDAIEKTTDWIIDKDFIETEYVAYKHSFFIKNHYGDFAPVYLFSHMKIPDDEGDELHEDILNFIMENDEEALVLLRSPVIVTDDEDNEYFFIGEYLADNLWIPVTLCKKMPSLQHHTVCASIINEPQKTTFDIKRLLENIFSHSSLSTKSLKNETSSRKYCSIIYNGCKEKLVNNY